MLDWLLRVLGLGPTQAPQASASSRRTEPAGPAMFTPRASAGPDAHDPAAHDHSAHDPDAYDIELLDPEPVRPPVFEPEPAPTTATPAAAHEPEPAPAAPPARAYEPEPAAHAALQFAAFALQTSAGARVFARPEDAHLVHEPNQPGMGGWEVHGFVTDSHPGLLFVLAAEGPTAIGPHGDRAAAHAFRIEESGDDAFALYDLATEAYLCAPRFLPDANPLESDRGVVNEWEIFHLIAVEGVALPKALPALLPPAGTPLTATILQSWRVAA